ncbi:MAG: GNAT family N-acetyltransferase [Roseburia sp.]|nr:GNAT family N-acetyltransferase [Ruminococcus sp.]MCM1155386.1 GNAT family N-acetyltransferase [Roseburia sp.]MCM1242845.1 GNAT family N-acetyltransferase [Roseburia sp.]
MDYIRKATANDISRLAEILVFTKRMQYRPIFHNDKVSFGELQVLSVAQEYMDAPERLNNIWVYDDEFVKGMLHVEGSWIKELYVDSFFQGQGIGRRLVEFAIQDFDVRYLFVLEKNESAIRFYQKRGFSLTKERQIEPGTPEYIVKMCRNGIPL